MIWKFDLNNVSPRDNDNSFLNMSTSNPNNYKQLHTIIPTSPAIAVCISRAFLSACM